MRRPRIITPGEACSVFLPDPLTSACIGAQHLLWKAGLAAVGDPRVADRKGWPVDELGVPAFDWADGDGANFLLSGVSTAFTATGGVPAAGQPTPWVDHKGVAVTATTFAADAHYRYTTAVDPTVGHDLVAMVLVRAPFVALTNNHFATRTGSGNGWMLGSESSVTHRFSVDAGPLASSVKTWSPGWQLMVGVYDADGLQYLYMNGALADSDPVAGTNIQSGVGIAVGGNPAGGFDQGSTIVRAVCWYGASKADIATASFVTRLSAAVLGTRGAAEGRQPAFTRTGAASKRVGTRWHVFGDACPRAGSAEGLLAEPQRVNKCYNTINPQATTGWSAAGAAVLSVLADTAQLLTDGLQDWGPNVLSVVGAGQAYGGALTANTNAHALTVAIRGVAGGESVDLCLRDSSSGVLQVVQVITCTTSYQVVQVTATPDANDQQWCLDVDGGDTVYAVMMQLEEGAYPSSPIPNSATAATATRAQDVLDTGLTPRDACGSVAAILKPIGWGGATPGADAQVVTRSGGAASLIRYESDGAGSWASQDGTSTVSPSVAPADGVENATRMCWRTGEFSLTVDGGRASDVYDGVLAASGTLRVASEVPVLVKDFELYQNGNEA